MTSVISIRRRNQEKQERYRCVTCEGRRRVWKPEGGWRPCPHCCGPDDARQAA